jgi:hypothetical protein
MTVWTDFNPRTSEYVGRCSHCGKYSKKEGFLKVHWFFNGVYCTICIVDILYDNARNLEEIRR